MLRVLGVVIVSAAMAGLSGEPGGEAHERSTEELLRLLESDNAGEHFEILNQLCRRSSADPTIVQTIMLGLDDEDAATRLRTLKDLSWFEGNAAAALPRVIQLLNDQNVEVAFEAAFKIKRFDPDRKGESTAAIPVLLTLLRSPEARRRHAAVAALGDFGNLVHDSIPAIMPLLSDNDPWVRHCAISALDDVGLPESEGIPLFTKMLRDPESHVRETAADVLGNHGSKAADAVPLIVSHLESLKKGESSYYALKALEKIGPAAKDALPFLEKALSDERFPASEVGRVLLTIGKRTDLVVAAMIKELEEQNGEGACDVIASIGPDASAAVPALIKVMQRKDWDQQWAAADALANIGPAAAPAIPVLIDALSTSGGQVIGASIKALSRIRAASVPALAAALHKSKPKKDLILDALACIGPIARQALPDIEPCLKDDDKDVRHWAGIAYGNINPKSALPLNALVDALKSGEGDFVKLQALLTLGRMGENAKPAVGTIEDLLLSTAKRLNARMPLKAKSLGQILEQKPGDEDILDLFLGSTFALAKITHQTDSVEMLKLSLSHQQDELVIAALEALNALEPPPRDCVQEIEKLCTHKNPDVKFAAETAKQKILGQK